MPSVYIGVSSVLALYSSGKTTGLVLDSGDGVTSVVPIYEGYPIFHASSRIDVGGKDLTDYLERLYRESSNSLPNGIDREIVRDIKETRCMVSLDY
jgi:actin-related protein